MSTSGTSSLEDFTRKTYGSEYHMPPVRMVLVNDYSKKPKLIQGRFFTGDYAELENSHIDAFDSAYMNNVESKLAIIQNEYINQNARTAAKRCTRGNDGSYLVFFDVLVAQTNETIAQFEDTWSVPEYGPYLEMTKGQCVSADENAANSTPPECLQLNGDQGQPNLGPFVGAKILSEYRRAPYPDPYKFSFPHTCPLKPWKEKTIDCRSHTHKGLCDLDQAPDGVTCTYAYEILGWVSLDDLVGITSLKDSDGKRYKSFETWCNASENNIEFAADVDTGEMEDGLDFWSDPLDKTSNTERVTKLISLYQDIVTGDTKSDLIPDSDLKYFKALPSVENLTAANPSCYQTVRKCNSGTGCKRVGLHQICTPCKFGEACPLNASYTLPTLAKANPALSDGLGGKSIQSSSSKSGLATPLIVGGVIVLVAGVVAFVLRRRGYGCFGRRSGRQQGKVDSPNLVTSDNAAGGEGVYVGVATPNKLTASVGTDGYESASRAKQRTTEEDDEFPGQLLVSVQIRYEDLAIGEVISHGGFGEVLLGTYKNQQVAVKRLLAARRRDRKSVASFIQEIKLNATLDHECLVRFIGAAWDVPENLCMVSEYLRGGDLRTLLSGFAAKGYPNGHDVGKLRTAIQIAQALTYLHGLDPPVIHRDLKSRNVLLTEVLDAKLIDFGVSTECIDETMTAGVGTSLWMAPEIMMGKRYDVKADVFSFGVILSELDTHEIPYDHVRDPESDRKLASALLNRLIYEGKVKPRFTEMADPEIVALARDCLELDPTKRPTSVQVLDRIRHSWQQCGRSKSRGGREMCTDSQSTWFETQETTRPGCTV